MALEDELSCSVCTELFRDPVLLSCGHSYCRQCINDHWTFSSSRNCPICRQVSLQEPVSNLSLRNTCECYLRERNKKDEEHECPIHGEKIKLFCQTDEETICATCVDYEHRCHKIQPLQQAARQRKVRKCVCESLCGILYRLHFILHEHKTKCFFVISKGEAESGSSSGWEYVVVITEWHSKRC